jgi:hypothetical protein
MNFTLNIKLFSLLICLAFSNINAQFNQISLSKGGITGQYKSRNYNHYSIERSLVDQSYVVAGTLFETIDGIDTVFNNDINILKLDENGNVLWEKTIDVSDDDRALDIEIDTEGNIYVTGYTINHSLPYMYICKIDATGNVLEFKSYSKSSVGTKLLVSEDANNVYVGGMCDLDFFPLNPQDNNISFQTLLHNKQALIISLDHGLNFVWEKKYSSERHGCINDMVLVNDILFATGSLLFSTQSSIIQQGVLCLSISRNSGSVIGNFSFNSSNLKNVGISASYDSIRDMMYVLVNNSVTHLPQISTINAFSKGAGAFLSLNSITFNLQLNNIGLLYSGYKLIQNPFNRDRLAIFGYRGNEIGSNPPVTRLWLLEFDKNTGLSQRFLVYRNKAAFYAAHGSDYFSTYWVEHPLIYNQEIATLSVDMPSVITPSNQVPEFICIAPNSPPGFPLGVDLTSSNDLCFDELPSQVFNITNNPIQNISVNSLSENFSNPFFKDYFDSSEEDNFCNENSYRKMVFHPKAISKDFDISPNPACEYLNVSIPEASNQKLVIRDFTGKIIELITTRGSKRLTIDLKSYPKGIYLIEYESSGLNQRMKFVKN